ncbi:MAG: hypothetical protein PHI66_02940 [Candidatus Pacebacteria bacterium]|nr:hypothetical protein [Candidatus Paceibacterota bacterium]
MKRFLDKFGMTYEKRVAVFLNLHCCHRGIGGVAEFILCGCPMQFYRLMTANAG